MSLDSHIAEHYAGEGLLGAIEVGLQALGKSRESVTVRDLGPVDEFHIGGRAATAALCERLGFSADSELLDIGSGIGGTARFLASTIGCRVTGIDLTPNYVDVARSLSAWTGLSERVVFEVGSALDMPFDDNSFDGATQLHVGMNIPGKEALFAEVHRVLRPGGQIGVYDVMRVSEGDITFPVPWASGPSTNFVADVATYRSALEAAGFEILAEENRAEFALEFFKALGGRSAEDGPAPFGLQLIIGADTPQKIGNMVGGIAAGVLAPVEMIARKV
ncbi:MAG: methyltransferase domain-containing protein [Actinomycetia bacterium]|nr:methyltransferase domain-containing protein [Actinomycetes bacterium]